MNILKQLKALKELGLDLNDIDKIEKFMIEFNSDPEVTDPEPEVTDPEPEPEVTDPEPEPEITAPEPKPSDKNYSELILESINKLTESLQASNRLNIKQPEKSKSDLADIANYIINGKDDNNGN